MRKRRGGGEGKSAQEAKREWMQRSKLNGNDNNLLNQEWYTYIENVF